MEAVKGKVLRLLELQKLVKGLLEKSTGINVASALDGTATRQ